MFDSICGAFLVARLHFLTVVYTQSAGFCQTHIVGIRCVFHMTFIAFVSVERIAVWHDHLERKTIFDYPFTIFPDTPIDPLIIDVKNVTLLQSYLSLRRLLFHLLVLLSYVLIPLLHLYCYLFAISLTIASFSPFTVSLYMGKISFTAVSASRHGALPGAILGFIHTIFL